MHGIHYVAHAGFSEPVISLAQSDRLRHLEPPCQVKGHSSIPKRLHYNTFAHVVMGNTLGTDIYDLPTTPTRKVCIEHAHIFFDFSLGMATEWLATLDQHGFSELMMETHHREPTLPKWSYLGRGTTGLCNMVSPQNNSVVEN